jgi:uncharacterized protein YoaH (UPF0181 family)
VEIHSIDERIKELCSRAVTAGESEVEFILAQLRAALREHTRIVRRMTAKTLNRAPKNYSSSKAAD